MLRYANDKNYGLYMYHNSYHLHYILSIRDYPDKLIVQLVESQFQKEYGQLI